jgi:hypothetical protein
MVDGGITPLILKLVTVLRLKISFTPRPLYPRGNSPRHLFDRRLDGPQSRSGRGGEKKCHHFTFQELEPRSSSPRRSLYSGWTLPTPPKWGTEGVLVSRFIDVLTKVPSVRPGFLWSKLHWNYEIAYLLWQVKVTAKLPLCLIKYHAVKIYRGAVI